MNKGIIELLLIFGTVLMIKRLQNRYLSFTSSKKSIKNKLKFYVPVIILTILGFVMFSNTIDSRVGGIWDQEFFQKNASINANAVLMHVVPDSFKPTMVYMTSYLTQGYYALSLALNEPFTPMYGIGNSMFLMDNFKKILGTDFFQYTYQTKLDYLGWDPLVNWHSIYVWLANDISFYGILPLLYFLGKFFGKISIDTINNKNPIACAIFCLLLVMFFYFPLNYQILSYPTTSWAFGVDNCMDYSKSYCKT